MLQLFFSLFLSVVQAHDCQVLVRNEKHRLVEAKVTLTELKSADSFDGKSFKIVKDKSDEAIKFNDPKFAFRACHVYYHLTQAYDYFLNHFDRAYLESLPQIVIRIEMPYSFVDSGHFAHEKFQSYNNSLSVPPSGRNRHPDVAPWNSEIWFAPAKKMKVKNAFTRASDLVTQKEMQENLRLGVIEGTATSWATQLAQGATMTSLEGQMYAESLILSLAIVTTVPYIVQFTSSLFKQTIYLDAAMIPEVIYHEFAHVAFSKHLKQTHHSPIIESYANYFASIIGKTDTILKRSRPYAKGLNKISAECPLKYDSWMEDEEYAQYPFAYCFLKRVHKVLGDEFGPKVIYESHKELNASSSIRVHLSKKLEETILKVAPADQKLSLQSRYLLLLDDIGL